MPERREERATQPILSSPARLDSTTVGKQPQNQPNKQTASHPLRRSTDVPENVVPEVKTSQRVDATLKQPQPATHPKPDNVSIDADDDLDPALTIRLQALRNRENAIAQREQAIAAREDALDAGAAMPKNLQGKSVDLEQLEALKEKERELKRQLKLLEKHEWQLIELNRETKRWLQQVS